MKHDAFSYRFTGKELTYMIFAKKKCPRCGEKMQKIKKSIDKKGAELNSKSDPFFVPNANVKQYVYYFLCSNCKKEYSLIELAKLERS